MKILYDHQMFSIQKYGGITKYFSEIVRNLPSEYQYELSLIFSDNQYLQEYSGKFGKCNIFPQKDFKGKYTLKKCNYFINNCYSVFRISMGSFDLFHPTFYDSYFLKYLKKPYVITVHDLIAFKIQDGFHDFSMMREKMKETISKASRIIAVSENTKKDIIELFKLNDSSIDVIYHGYNLPKVSITVNEFGRYILFVGNRQGYKNFRKFLSSVANLFTNDRELKLICVGLPFSDEEVSLFKAWNINEQIFSLNAGENLLNHLYSHAQAFIYPSLYEGFGMPILEAFANNCPVCLAEVSCFPEVAGEAGTYFDPNSEYSILNAVKKIIYDRDYALEKIEVGKKMLSRYSWEKAANDTVLTYQKVI